MASVSVAIPKYSCGRTAFGEEVLCEKSGDTFVITSSHLVVASETDREAVVRVHHGGDTIKAEAI